MTVYIFFVVCCIDFSEMSAPNESVNKPASSTEKKDDKKKKEDDDPTKDKEAAALDEGDIKLLKTYVSRV